MFRTALRTLVATSIALALAGCQDAARPVRPEPTTSSVTQPLMSPVAAQAAHLVLHVIAPRLTDPDINFVPAADSQLNRHYAWVDASVRGNPKLLVFMPGSNGKPFSWQRLGEEAARLGYHVIGLMYQNNVEVVNVCGGSANPGGHSLDPDCSGNLRLEILDGQDHSALTVVTAANGIYNRLTKVLVYLSQQYPGEGWSRFLEEDGTLKWSQIAVAGQSQGAAQAALIGRLHHVDRVVMFSGPPDARVPEVVDSWVFIGRTPAAKYFALFHQRDHLVVGIRANLAALDMGRFGDPVQVESSESPYGETHILMTDLPPQGGYIETRPHQSTARDDRTPLAADGTPLLLDAWRYLLGAH